jgi:predicted kinase
MSSGIDLWNSMTRSRIEQFQLALTLELLREGRNVVIEWGVWTRKERDELRNAARAVGAAVELHYVTAPIDELWRRIVERDLEGRWGSHSLRRDELDAWVEVYEEPDAKEMATYDSPKSD